jgi:hypothetical protein
VLARVVRGDPAAGRFALVCAVLLVAMTLATAVNPYGFELHRQAFAHLSLPSTAYFVEFLSPNFRDGHAAVRAFASGPASLGGVIRAFTPAGPFGI